MSWRPCLDCGVVVENRRRCPPCESRRNCQRDAKRGTSSQRGYGADHKAERAAWEPIVQAGAVVCRRCHELIRPGQAWDLGHPVPKAPEHTLCNRSGLHTPPPDEPR
jgi:RNA polymerase subunit RPABC4/transcription elongation factor Spt4